MKQGFLARFHSSYRFTPEGCWEWTGSTNKHGYGQMRVFGNVHGMHRISYELFNGPIGGLHIDHTCKNRACVNPRHLEAVTQAENNRRSPASPEARGRRLMSNHPLFILRRARRTPRVALAARAGVSQYTILNIESWRFNPRPSTLAKIAAALECDVADITPSPDSLEVAS